MGKQKEEGEQGGEEEVEEEEEEKKRRKEKEGNKEYRLTYRSFFCFHILLCYSSRFKGFFSICTEKPFSIYL